MSRKTKEDTAYLEPDLDYQCVLFPVNLKLKNFSAPEVGENNHWEPAETEKFKKLLKTENRLAATAVIFEKGEPQVVFVRFVATDTSFDPENLFAFEMEKGNILADLTLHVKDGRKVEVNLARYDWGFDIATSPVV